MAQSYISCSYCGIEFLKENKYIRENLKIGNNSYCSLNCQYSYRDKKQELTCENSSCGKKFKRMLKGISPHNYCSRSCAVSINNVVYPKVKALIKKCNYCFKELHHLRRYCSIECKSNSLTLSEYKVIERIREFYSRNGRIPVKREVWGLYKPARKYFGTWNEAIKTAGFKPNPVLFADNCVANDGHICNSVAEKIIDDYLSDKRISHERNIFYPEGKYTFDFKIGNRLIEYFGLAGEHKRYDQLRRIKQRMVKRYGLQLVEIYPKDLYPHSKLEQILAF